MTHRQYCAWNAWLKEQWNVPSRADWYTLRVAAEVRGVLGKRPDEKELVLQFRDSKPKTRAEADEAAKAKWGRMFKFDPQSGDLTPGQIALKELVLRGRERARTGTNGGTAAG